MCQLVEARRVEVGTKLVLHGSELLGATSPCHPLQVLSSLLIFHVFKILKEEMESFTSSLT